MFNSVSLTLALCVCALLYRQRYYCTTAVENCDVHVFCPTRYAVVGKMATVALVSRPASVLPKITSE